MQFNVNVASDWLRTIPPQVFLLHFIYKYHYFVEVDLKLKFKARPKLEIIDINYLSNI